MAEKKIGAISFILEKDFWFQEPLSKIFAEKIENCDPKLAKYYKKGVCRTCI